MPDTHSSSIPLMLVELASAYSRARRIEVLQQDLKVHLERAEALLAKAYPDAMTDEVEP